MRCYFRNVIELQEGEVLLKAIKYLKYIELYKYIKFCLAVGYQNID